MNSLIGIKNQLVHKGIQHLHVCKQATKISEMRLHYLGYIHYFTYFIDHSLRQHIALNT